MPDPMNEQVPGVPQMNPVQAIMQRIAAMRQQASSPVGAGGGAPQGGGIGAPPRGGMAMPTPVPGTPPAMPGQPGGAPSATGSPLPSMPANIPGRPGTGAPMGAQGPAFGAVAPFNPPQEYSTKSARNAGIASGAISNIMQGAIALKQQQFQRRAQSASALVSQYIALKQSDDPRLQKQADALLQDKKNSKIIEKAQKDPNSPEYLGIAKAQQDAMTQAQGQQQQEAKLKLIRAQMQEAAMNAAKAQAAIPREGAERRIATHQDPTGGEVLAARTSKEIAEEKSGQVTRGPVQQDPKTGQWRTPWFNKAGQIDHFTPASAPPSTLPTDKTTTTSPDANGNPVTHTITQKLTPEAAGRKTTFGGIPINKATSQEKNTMIENYAWQWAVNGNKPPNKTLQTVVNTFMVNHGMTPGMAPTADMLRRGSMAQVMLAPQAGSSQSLLDKTISEIENNKDKMASISQRTVNSLDGFAKVLPPELSTISANLQSIYSVGAGVHGWRSIKAPGEFAKAYGTISMRPDALIANLKELKKFAETVASVSTKSPTGNPGAMRPPGSQAPAPAAPGAAAAEAPAQQKMPKVTIGKDGTVSIE